MQHEPVPDALQQQVHDAKMLRGSIQTGILKHLTLEFARIDLMLQREVRRWVLADQDPNDDYRGLYIAQSEAELLCQRPFNTSWGQWITLPADEDAAFQAALAKSTGRIEQFVEMQRRQGRPTLLQRICEEFALDRTARDIFLLSVAPAFDTKYERIYGYLQDNVTRRRPSVRLILDLLGEPGANKFALATYLAEDAPLFRAGILEHVVEPPPANAHWLNQTIHVDETVTAWLRGCYEPQGMLAGHAALMQVDADEADAVLTGDIIARLHGMQFDSPQTSPMIALYGADMTRHDATARRIAAMAGKRLLTVAVGTALAEQSAPADLVVAAGRDARLTNAVLYLRKGDGCIHEDGALDENVLETLCIHPGVVVLSSAKQWRPAGRPRTRRIRWVEIDMPDDATRDRLWRRYLNGAGAALDDADIAELAGQFALTSGAIRDAVAAARDQAEGEQPTLENLFHAARLYSNPRLSALARKVEPRYGWSDLILPVHQLEILQELVATVRQRPKVLGEWGVGRKLAASRGVTVLFAGPPGTGKTMAAEVIAGELRLDLYKIDLSSVVSKYIGETEKNLERIFTEAASSNAILLFDEADSLFGKRTETKDAHDRYANLEISYLLQRMEAYDGVTILATNLAAHLDEAFTRRLHFAVDFPFPRHADRLRIWQTLFPAGVPCDPQLDFALLAKTHELAGGNIRNIIVSAAYLAADNGQVVTMEHLQHAAKRELRKMGRLLDG